MVPGDSMRPAPAAGFIRRDRLADFDLEILIGGDGSKRKTVASCVASAVTIHSDAVVPVPCEEQPADVITFAEAVREILPIGIADYPTYGTVGTRLFGFQIHERTSRGRKRVAINGTRLLDAPSSGCRFVRCYCVPDIDGETLVRRARWATACRN